MTEICGSEQVYLCQNTHEYFKCPSSWLVQIMTLLSALPDAKNSPVKNYIILKCSNITEM